MTTLYHGNQLPLFALTKVCSQCHQEKPIEEFDKASDQKSGYRPNCKDGHKNRCKACDKEYRNTHQDGIREYSKEWNAQNRDEEKIRLHESYLRRREEILPRNRAYNKTHAVERAIRHASPQYRANAD